MVRGAVGWRMDVKKPPSHVVALGGRVLALAYVFSLYELSHVLCSYRVEPR